MIYTCIFAQIDIAPEITAKGNQLFCPESDINIVTDFTITDADNVGVQFFFIQISSGYQNGFDELEMLGNHPTINQFFNQNDGKLTLSSKIAGSEILFSDLEQAVKQVVFRTSSANVSEEKVFSLTIDDANYLPKTEHFYEFVADLGITWKNAKVAAENRTYFGRKGYLATLTSQEEADFAGKQASGAGWIGGSDEETEGVWKWVTGPEAGKIFWNGQVSGTTPDYANWNRNEPNDFRGNNTTGEDYAHITDPNVPNVIVGSWNDLPNTGGTGLYIAKGYVVEYGAPGDPVLNIATSTRIYLPTISGTVAATICESGTATISATSSDGNILWFENQTGGASIASGNSFTTPTLTSSKKYYVTVSGCATLERKEIEVVVNKKPTITNITEDLICTGIAVLAATASDGEIYWYDANGVFLQKGSSYLTPNLTSTTSYYVEANNANCVSFSRTEIVATLDNTIPDFEMSQNPYVLCDDIGSVKLEAINFLGNYRYVWKKEGVIVSGNSSSINADEPGNYSVKAISLAGCESLEIPILVKNSSKATITKEDIFIIDDSNNNSIEVINTNLGIGAYEFSLDNEFGTYKEEGLFKNIAIGTHTLFIKDKNGCGIAKYVFSILSYPKFFTPNGDGNNDLWKIDGFDTTLFTVSDIYIYNRFGVLLYKIGIGNDGWDGKYQGKDVPPNTYWFRANLIDTNNRQIEKIGNFSLIRN